MNARDSKVYGELFKKRWSLWTGLARKKLRARLAAGSMVDGQWTNASSTMLSESELEEGAQNIVARAWERLQRPNNRTDNPSRDIAMAICCCVRDWRKPLGRIKPSRQYVDALDRCGQVDTDVVSALVVRQSTEHSQAEFRAWIRQNIPRELWAVAVALSAAEGDRKETSKLLGTSLRTVERRLASMRKEILG